MSVVVKQGRTRVPQRGFPGSQFIQKSGQKLTLAGKPYRFLGLNVWRANVTSWNQPPSTSYLLNDGTALDTSLKDMLAVGPRLNVFRTWFIQQFAVHSGAYDWSTFDKTLSVAAANGFRVIATLADQWSYETDDTDYGPGYKTPTWWQTGYKTGPWTSFERVSYRQYVQDVVTRYANDPRILMWELVNEPEVADDPQAATPVCNANAQPILSTFVADIGTLIKSIDSNHLVSLGAGGSGTCGLDESEYQTVHSDSHIDLLSYHDYQPYSGNNGLTPHQRFIQSYEQFNGLQTRIPQAIALNKPIYIGEAGLHSSQSPFTNNLSSNFPGRGWYMDQKMNYAFNVYTGIVGYVPWQFDDRGESASGDDYVYGPGDPSLSVISSYGGQR